MLKRLQHAVSCLMLCVLLLPCMTAPAAAAGFSDVPASHWAAASIQRCVELGFFQGESATRFGLGHPMTRASFAVVLSRFFGWKAGKAAESVYNDVPAGAWYAGAVQAAYENGAFTRQSDDFRPADPVTREELAVILVRALGYGTLAGLVQDLPMPFRDVTTNAGYIAMAYELGLMDGTSATAFSPDRIAAREDLAVILVRLYDKLHGAAPVRVGIASSAAELPDLTGFEAVAVESGKLLYQEGKVQMVPTAAEEDTAALREAAKSAGTAQLLYAPGTANILRGDSGETARTLAAAATAGGYDGVFLDVSGAAYGQKNALTQLANALDKVLEEKLLYVAAEAPVWQGKSSEGYDYGKLAAAADCLVLRAASREEKAGAIPTAPVEPLEEAYYALGELRGKVDMKKVSLLLTTSNTVWTEGKRTGTLSGLETARLRDRERMGEYYSSRYACAYLSGTVDRKNTVVWYLSGQSAAERVKLLSCFGVGQVCFSQLNGLLPEVLEAVK